jgi:Zn-dependent protease
MHAYVAYKLGDHTAFHEGRISFNPLNHIDPILTVALQLVLILLHIPPILAAKPVPFNPLAVKYGEYGAALMALAGPFSNLGLAVVGALMLRIFDISNMDGFAFDFIYLFITVNVGLFVFNMLPIPPLDGSRLLYALAPEPVQRVMEQIESMGLIVVFLVVFLFSGFLGPILRSLSSGIIEFILR